MYAPRLSAVRGKLAHLETLRIKRTKLRDGEHRDYEWNTYEKRLCEAFNEGAGRAVLS